MKRQITLLDGGLGQEVYHRSNQPAHPLWSVKVMLDQPQIVQAVHEDFVRAGARILTLNTYAATPTRLARDGEAAWLESAHQLAFKLADAARRDCGSPHGPVQLAAPLPPLPASYSPKSRLPYEQSLSEYRTLVDLQPDVDLFLCETIPSIEEAHAAATAAVASGRPVLVSFTLSDESPDRLRSGESVEDAVEALAAFSLAGLLFNCSTPEVITRALPHLQKAPCPFGAYANGFESVAPLTPGGTVDVLASRKDLDPAAYTRAVQGWVNQGATLVGGCCEVGPAHIDHVHRSLRDQGCEVTGLPG